MEGSWDNRFCGLKGIYTKVPEDGPCAERIYLIWGRRRAVQRIIKRRIRRGMAGLIGSVISAKRVLSKESGPG
jgi:hypothetical protein